jgi:hypothetical protein
MKEARVQRAGCEVLTRRLDNSPSLSCTATLAGLRLAKEDQ